MKPDLQVSNEDTQASKPFQMVRTPPKVMMWAAVALCVFFAFVAFYYFGPKSQDDLDPDARPVGGNKVLAPLAPASAASVNR